MATIGDCKRRKILDLLGRHGEMSVRELAANFDITRPAVSQHLAILLEARLIRVRPCDPTRLYRIEPTGRALIENAIAKFWHDDPTPDRANQMGVYGRGNERSRCRET